MPKDVVRGSETVESRYRCRKNFNMVRSMEGEEDGEWSVVKVAKRCRCSCRQDVECLSVLRYL